MILQKVDEKLFGNKKIIDNEVILKKVPNKKKDK